MFLELGRTLGTKFLIIFLGEVVYLTARKLIFLGKQFITVKFIYTIC